METNTATITLDHIKTMSAEQLDRVAASERATVVKAAKVRKVSMEEAMQIVATHTNTDLDVVKAMFERGTALAIASM